MSEAYDLAAVAGPDEDEPPWSSPTTWHGGGCFKPGNVHPLPVMLGDDWYWLTDAPNQWLIVLHKKSGLWLRVEWDFFRGTGGHPMDPEMFAIGRALQAGVREGLTGSHLLATSTDPDDGFVVELWRVP